jgi:hypothetical protein
MKRVCAGVLGAKPPGLSDCRRQANFGGDSRSVRLNDERMGIDVGRHTFPHPRNPKCAYSENTMLRDRRKFVEANSNAARQSKQSVNDYAEFLAAYFSVGDWFTTLTFRDRHHHLEIDAKRPAMRRVYRETYRFSDARVSPNGLGICPPDPRIQAWEPTSRFRYEPGPPVRDAALREINHFLLELGWEAAGRSRQEIFDWMATGKNLTDRMQLARRLSGKCLFCALLVGNRFKEHAKTLRAVATNSIGWVIAEEFGRLGGRWHVHLLIRGATKLRRLKWWRRAFIRFGRARIEAIHE